MSGSKSVALCLLIILCFSCAQKGIIVCRDDKLRCEKYSEVLRSIGLSPVGLLENQKPSLWVSSTERARAIKAINLVGPYFVEQGVSDKENFAEIFVPVLKSNSSKLSEAIRILSSIPGIFAVGCKENPSINEAIRVTCKISFLSSMLSQGQIEEHLNLSSLNSRLNISYVDLSKALSSSGLVSGDQNEILRNENFSEMMKLSPFSFHVPYAEKEIAGIQLILVLGVFLFSGIILGFWLGTKERKHGRKSI